MTRHARNCTAGAVYSYHEKQQDSQRSGYGGLKARLGKDSIRDFDACCLSLQPCRNPVLTPEGYLFDKESLLEYVITKKNENSRKLKEYERQKKLKASEVEEKAAKEEEKRVKEFMRGEKDLTKGPSSSSSSAGPSSSSSWMADGNNVEKVPSFWIPSQTPDASAGPSSTMLREKPDPTVYCPMSGRPLKMKDLITVKFTEIKDPADKRSLIAKDVRYMCPVTRDSLGNSVPCAVIKTTGDVITMDCFEKIIKKDWLHPLTGDKLTEKDIIPLQRGGTGYASTNANLEAKQHRPSLQV